MKNGIVSGLLLAGLLAASAAGAECVYPKAPATMPDGATATKDQMVEGMKAVKAYNAQVTDYLTCLENDMNKRVEDLGADASPEAVEQIKAIHNKRHNAAVSELEEHAARFNEQVKTYKARNGKS